MKKPDFFEVYWTTRGWLRERGRRETAYSVLSKCFKVWRRYRERHPV